jgi:elongation factor Ts
MSNFTVADIQELREFTGAGMLDVKNALTEAGGDKARAIEIIRVKGLKGLAKREDRETTEGLVAAKIVDQNGKQAGYLVELNCETDFVAKSPKFVEMAQNVVDQVAQSQADSVEAAADVQIDGQTLVDFINQTAAVFNEKVVLKNVARIEADQVTLYLHRHSNELPPYLGTLVGHSQLAVELANPIAQHIAGLAPKYLSREHVPAEVLDSEKRVASEMAAKENKPENIIPKIIEGRLNTFYKDSVFLDQPLAKDPSVNLKQYLAKNSTHVTSYARLAVGEPALVVN